jgi:hypothetical protein
MIGLIHAPATGKTQEACERPYHGGDLPVSWSFHAESLAHAVTAKTQVCVDGHN